MPESIEIISQLAYTFEKLNQLDSSVYYHQKAFEYDRESALTRANFLYIIAKYHKKTILPDTDPTTRDPAILANLWAIGILRNQRMGSKSVSISFKPRTDVRDLAMIYNSIPYFKEKQNSLPIHEMAKNTKILTLFPEIKLAEAMQDYFHGDPLSSLEKIALFIDVQPMDQTQGLESLLDFWHHASLIPTTSPKILNTLGAKLAVKKYPFQRFLRHSFRDLHAEEIGFVTDTGRVRYFTNDELVGDVPAESLVLGGGAPQYNREYSEPAYYSEFKKFNIDSIEMPSNLKEVGFAMLGLPNIASKKWVYEQYDSMVGTRNMTTNRPSDAGVVNIKGTNKALAMTVDCNSRYVNADPEIGTMIAVSEAARNIVCAGGIPSAITNCLNFGNPYNPESYWQFVGAIKGMSTACLKFKTPVTGGNVSFYNQTSKNGVEIPVFPTPTIGMIGIVPDKDKVMTLDFKQKGDLIFLIGEYKNDISSSEYLATYLGVKASPAPYFDLEKEFQMQEAVKGLIEENIVNAVHDVADGGLYVTLIEMSLPRELGFDIVSDSEIREDAFLFGEGQGRVVVTVSEEKAESFLEYMIKTKVNITLLGHVTKGKLQIDEEHFGFISEAKNIYDNALAKHLEN
ncbi:MAG: hypothetical protein EBU61_01865 [Crocinitomicaceae bacterium]|nr:hypothetical protein [Crocinitomicaceae bacterium]